MADGEICVSNIDLNVSAINEQLERDEVPITVIDGYIRQLRISIPVMSILNDNSSIAVEGLVVTVQVTNILTEA